jgi:CheY-like chemotaxis protein
VDDDKDEWLLFKTALSDLKVNNKLMCFKNGVEAFQFLSTATETPFLILCDVNMPVMNGFELRRRLFDDPVLRKKSIPFIFHSSSASPEEVEKAYELTVQGFFIKTSGFEQISQQLKFIIDYWKNCREPNTA